MNATKKNNQIKSRRVKRTRAKLFGTSASPRLSVFRSNKFTYAQLIDDTQGKTLVSVSTKDIKKEKKVTASEILGETLAKKAKDAKIDAAVFDRGGYKYHGRVKAIAEGARKGGLKI